MKNFSFLSKKIYVPIVLIFSFSFALFSCSKNRDLVAPNPPSVSDSISSLNVNTLNTIVGGFTTVKPAHIVIAVYENHSQAHIIGNSQAPFINSLLKDVHTANFTQSFAVSHPSQPNYIALFSGSTQGITNDNTPYNTPWSAANLGAGLLSKGVSFKGFSEDLPYAGFTGSTSGYYARKHNPWVDWQGTGTNRLPSSVNQPFSAFPSSYTSLPVVSFVVPNLNDDMHNGTIAQGDTWLKNHLNNYIQWAKANNSLFILTFDEDDYTESNQIATLFVGANVKGGSYSTRITHYNVLRTIEQLYGTGYAGASSTASPISGIWLR